MTNKPEFKLEIEDVDASQYVVDNGRIPTLTTDAIGRGHFFLSTEFPETLKDFQEVKFYLNFTSDTHLFTGLITKIKELKGLFKYRIDIANTSYRALKRTATNKFRSDAGTGNARYIVTALIDEYLPQFSYDTDSIPTTTYEFKEQAYQNKYLNEIFDYIAGTLNRQWWVDKDKVFHMKSRDFSLVSEPISKNNFKGALDVNQDESKMANYVTVDGARLSVDVLQSGTLTSEKAFDLTYTPEAITKVEWDGSRKTIAKEGVDGYDDTSKFDGYTKVGEKQIQFNDISLTGSGTVTYQTMSIVHDELQDSASIEEFGFTKEKVITNEEITTQEDARELAQNYLDNYSLPLDILSGDLIITSQSQITNWQIGNKVPISYDEVDDDYKIVGITYHFGTGGVRLSAQFTDFPETNQDLFKQLVLKVKQKEERERRSSQNIVKYFFFGANLYLELENLSIRKQNVMGDMLIWNHPSKGTWNSFKWSSGTTEPWEEMIVINSDRGYVERFETDWFKGDSSRGANWDTVNRRLEL